MQNAGKIYANKVSAQMDEQNLNSDVCWFCDKPAGEKESSATHENADKWSSNLMILGGIGGFIAGLVLPFVIFLNLQITPDKDFNGIVIFSMFGGAVSGVILGYLLGQKIAFAFAPGTKPQTHAKHHPLIRPLIEQGWRLGKPE